MLITTKQPQKKDACSSQAVTFQTEWPDGMKPTLANCLRVAKLGLGLDWFAGVFLPTTARKKYDKAIVLAREKYDKATGKNSTRYDKAIVPVREEFDKATALALEKYDKSIALALFHTLKLKKSKP